jgi:hypothetical protein
MVALPLRVPYQAHPQHDEGPVEPSFRLNYVTLLLKFSAEQQLDLTSCLRNNRTHLRRITTSG